MIVLLPRREIDRRYLTPAYHVVSVRLHRVNFLTRCNPTKPKRRALYDYLHRAMPYNSPGTLSPREVYSLTAFLLFKNHIIDSTITIDSKNLPQVVMPARELFIVDDRNGGPEIK